MPVDNFDEDMASRYDDGPGEEFDAGTISAAAGFLAGLAAGGAALEFGIGTGRIALPLAALGVPVTGIDLSRPMVARLAAKPGGDAIAVTIGDFAVTRVPGQFRLVYLVFNTIGNLTTQDEQVACFANAAAHLAPGGCFVIELCVPDLRRLPPGETIRPFLVSADRLGFDEYDVVAQGLTSHHYWIADGQWRNVSMPFRYAWPAELDLMARLAGLRLRERWSGWEREPFTAESAKHISVWQKAD